MQSAQSYKVLAILVLFCTKHTNGEFGAYAPEFVHIPAQLNAGVYDELLRNGLYAEIIGEVADPKEACGIVLLDYTAYVDGELFEAAIKPIEDFLHEDNKQTFLNETLRMEVYNLMKAKALAEHKNGMRKLFDMRRVSTPLYKSTDLQFFPYAGVVALGIGMGLGGLIFKGVESFFEDSELDEYKLKAQTQWKAFGESLMDIINGVTVQTSSNHFGSSFALVQSQVYAQVHNTLDQLFGFGKVAGELLERSSNRSLMSAIERLVGERFNTSLLALHGIGARDALKATVIGMNSETMEIKICYPTTTVSDIDYLVRVEPLGQFLPNMTSYWMHDVGGLYAVGKAQNQSINLATLKMVEHESLCKHSSSVMLCNLQEQMSGCGLLSTNRHNCRLVIHNSTDKHFTMVRPLARSMILATRATEMMEMPQELHSIPESKVITKPVFAVEVPRGKWLMVGIKAVHSRIVQGVMGADFKVIVPDTMPNYTPNASPHMASDSWISDSWMRIFDVSTLQWLITVVIFTVLYWRQYKKTEALERAQSDTKQWRDHFDNHRMHKYPHIYD